MKFDKKFNVKHLVTVSAVALAMIGGGAMLTNANTNVHADEISEDLAIDKQATKGDEEQATRDENHAAYVAAKTHPTILANDLEYHPNWIKGHKQELVNRLTPQQRKTIKQLMAFENGKSNYAPSTKDLGGNTPSSTESDKYAKEHTSVPKLPSFLSGKTTHHVSNHKPTSSNKESASVVPTTNSSQTTPSKSKSKRTHLSKATVRKIMNSRRIMKRMRADKRAIRKDKKRLSSRNARKFMRNYTKRSKSVKRTKRAQKRAMAVKGAKRYVRYYKDEVKHEKDLVRLIKSTRVSKVTKRHARKSLKRVRKNIRKNRKNVKKAHKITRHHSNKDRK